MGEHADEELHLMRQFTNSDFGATLGEFIEARVLFGSWQFDLLSV
jgi:hypothetical protein